MAQQEPHENVSRLKQALAALQKLQDKLQAVEAKQREPVAIIGMSCRFPGGSSTPEAFWRLLSSGQSGRVEIPPDRWDIDAYYDPNPDIPGKMATRYGYFLDRVDLFDAAFFKIAPREARFLDPQQRMLLEVVWEALEHAGLPPHRLPKRTGIFIGICDSEFDMLFQQLPDQFFDGYADTGSTNSIASGRLSHFLNLQGPNFVVDTACSSSLVAVHLAVQSLRAGESDAAIVGAVNCMLSPRGTISSSQGHFLAADGRCKTFDAAADGYARGEGCGAVVLKRLSDAQKAGDQILAVIRGSAINHDGQTSGLTVPSGPSQQAVIRSALANAGVRPADIAYVEAHGTGTSLGDPIEVNALGAVFAERDQPLYLGAVKTNVGHLEAASGMAGLFKVILSLQHGIIPAHLNFQTPNPHLAWDELPVQVVTAARPWPEGRKLAGISCFGLSGTNSHVIIEAAPPAPAPAPAEPAPPARTYHLLPLAGRGEAAVRDLAQRYAQHLAAHPDLNLADICHSAATGRVHFPQRLALVADSTSTAQAQLAALATDGAAGSPAVMTGSTPHATVPRVAFLFTGHGAQYVNMGRQLDATSPTFRAAIDACEKALAPLLDRSLREIMYPADGDAHAVMQTMTYSQPAIFAIGYALATLWQSWGVSPDVVLGHSIGEYAAACVAGAMSLEDALKLVVARGRLMDAAPRAGSMATIFADEATVAAAIAPYLDQVAIAAINAPERIVISGESAMVETLLQALEQQGYEARRLHVAQAGHSPLLEPVLDAFAQIANTVTCTRPHTKLLSGLTGQPIGADELNRANYWRRHLREPVQFAAMMHWLFQDKIDCFVEIGSHPMLVSLGQMCRPDNAAPGTWVGSLRNNQDDWQQMLTSLGKLYVNGVKIDWDAVYPAPQHQRVTLPTYPFQRQRYWLPPAPEQQRSRLHPLVDTLTRSPLLATTIAETRMSLAAHPWLNDHRVFDALVMPGAGHLALVLSVAALLGPPAPWLLRDVMLPQPLIVPPTGDVQVQLLLTPASSLANSSANEFRLISFAPEGDTQDYATHATGTLILAEPVPQPAATLEQLQARCVEPFDPNQIYTISDSLTVGSSFRWLAEVWRGEGEALARLVRPEVLEGIDDYILQVGLVDACFQVMGGIRDALPPGQNMLPFTMEALHLVPPAYPSKEWWAAAHQVAPMTWDLTLWSGDGQLLAVIKGFQFRVVRESGSFTQEQHRSWLYSLAWRDQPLLPARSARSAQAGRWLILETADDLGKTLVAQLQQQGQAGILVHASAPTTATNGAATINLADPAAVDHLIQTMTTDQKTPLQGVVYLATPADASPDALPDQAQVIYTGALHLAQALTQMAHPPRLWLVTRGAQAVAANDPIQMAGSPLWGLARTIAHEHPDLECSLVDLPMENDPSAVVNLIQELLTAGPETQVAYRRGQRAVARLERYRPTATPTDAGIHANASYLITGGLGGLGLEVARGLVAEGARYLVLSGRSGATRPAAQAAIAELEAAGAKVQVVAADVAQRADVARLLAACEQMAPLRGIIHAAGVLDDGVLHQQTAARYTTVAAPKVQGAWHLHILTQNTPLDFFVLFSSAASLLGSAGQANYAAANAFLDSLAHTRTAQGRPTLSINWGAWAEVGLAAQRSDQAWTTESGMGMLTPAQGITVFNLLRQQAVSQVGVLPVNWSRYLQHLPLVPSMLAGLAPAAPAQPAAPVDIQQRLHKLAPEAWPEVVSNHVRQIVTRVLCLEPTFPLDADQLWLELGMDSLMGVEIINQIRQTLGVKVSVGTVLQSGSITSVTTSILTELRLAILGNAAAPSPQAQPQLSAADAALVVLQPGTDQVPVFFIHPIGGNVLCYYPLVQHLDPSWPCYGLQSPGLLNNQPPLERIEDMAACYLNAIRTVQPHGPYQLVGWSLGGIIAFEMARQLHQQGERVNLLVLIDSLFASLEQGDLQEQFQQSENGSMLAYFLADLQLTDSTNLEFPLELGYLEPDEQWRVVIEQGTDPARIPPGMTIDQLRALWRVFLANTQAWWNYTPGIYPDPITLLYGVDQQPAQAVDLWPRHLTEQLTCHPLPGNHYTLMQEPLIQEVAARLLEIRAAAQYRANGEPALGTVTQSHPA